MLFQQYYLSIFLWKQKLDIKRTYIYIYEVV